MKNNIKIIVGFIIGSIITGTIVYAGTIALNANNITYNNDTVKNAMDDLYKKTSDDIFTKLNLSSSKITSNGICGNKGTYTIDLNLYSGLYIIVGTEATSYNNNGITATTNLVSTSYPKVETNNGTCTQLKGSSNSSVAAEKVNSTNQALVERSNVYICRLSSDGIVTVTTTNASASTTENTNLIAHAIKLS